jgi:hypothetical protein
MINENPLGCPIGGSHSASTNLDAGQNLFCSNCFNKWLAETFNMVIEEPQVIEEK